MRCRANNYNKEMINKTRMAMMTVMVTIMMTMLMVMMIQTYHGVTTTRTETRKQRLWVQTHLTAPFTGSSVVKEKQSRVYV